MSFAGQGHRHPPAIHIQVGQHEPHRRGQRSDADGRTNHQDEFVRAETSRAGTLGTVRQNEPTERPADKSGTTRTQIRWNREGRGSRELPLAQRSQCLGANGTTNTSGLTARFAERTQANAGGRVWQNEPNTGRPKAAGVIGRTNPTEEDGLAERTQPTQKKGRVGRTNPTCEVGRAPHRRPASRW